MVYRQDLDECDCEEGPVQPPPGGQMNDVPPTVSGVCHILPSPPGGQMGGQQMGTGMMDPINHGGWGQMGQMDDVGQMDFGQMGGGTTPTVPTPTTPSGVLNCFCHFQSYVGPTKVGPSRPISGPGLCSFQDWTIRFKYRCKAATQRPQDPADNFNPNAYLGDSQRGEISNLTEETPDSQTCGGAFPCGGTCSDRVFTWTIKYCREVSSQEPTGTGQMAQMGQMNGQQMNGQQMNGQQMEGQQMAGSQLNQPLGDAAAADGVSLGEGRESGGTSVSPGMVSTGNNTPAVRATTTKIDPQNLGVIPTGGVNNNLPGDVFGQPSTAEFPPFPVEDIIYDADHNVELTSNQNLLSFATNPAANPIYSQNGLLKREITSTLADVLRTDNNPYGGAAVSTILYNKQAIPNAVKESVAQKLEELNNFNVASLNGKVLLTGAIRRSAILGTLDQYDQNILDQIIEAGKSFFPLGVPRMPEGFIDGGSRLAYSVVRNSDAQPLLPTRYSDSDRAREIQRWRAVPSDIDLTVPVTLRSGTVTGVRVKDDDGIPVGISGAAQPEKVIQLNEFTKVQKQDTTVETVSLVSNRDKAFVIPIPQENMIQSITGGGYEPRLVVSSTTLAGSASVEVSGEGSAIPSVMLFSSVRDSIKTTLGSNSDIKSTTVDYELAWDSITDGSDYTKFNATVSSWTGPRMSIYIDYRDPVWNYLMEKNTVKLLLSDFVRPVDGNVYARKIYTDFCIYPTDLVKYSPYQARSELTTFEEGQNAVRTVTLLSNPLGSVAQETYVQSTPTDSGKGPSGQTDNFSFQYEARDSIVGQAASLHGTNPRNFVSQKSPLGKVLDRVTDIAANYDITDGARGRRIPQPDIFFNMTANEVAEFFQFVPDVVRLRVLDGVYNNIEIFTVKNSDREKTFLTQDRLTGTALTNKVQNTALKNSRYFPSEYRGKLYRD